jgi:ArsR family transcriptional regulator
LVGEKMQDLLAFFKCLGDQTRLKMLKLLMEDELCVCQMTAILDKSQSSISQHLGHFKKLDLLKKKKEGKWTYYSIYRKKFDEYLADILGFSGKTFEELDMDGIKKNMDRVIEVDICDVKRSIK